MRRRRRICGAARQRTGGGQPLSVGVAPAGEARNLALGRPWVTVRPHYGGLPFNGLNAARMKAGESWPDQGATRPPSGSGKLRSRGQKSPRWSAERRPRSPKESAAKRKTGAPLGAPSPRLMRGRKTVPAKRGEGRRRTRRRKEYGRWRTSARLAAPKRSEDGLFEI